MQGPPTRELAARDAPGACSCASAAARAALMMGHTSAAADSRLQQHAMQEECQAGDTAAGVAATTAGYYTS
jgi:hypothetical protein